jgi:cytochrome c oxidase assembly protein subunit 11
MTEKNMHRIDDTPAAKTRIHMVLAAVAVLMFGFAFALVPLYDTLCRVLGINGKIEPTAYAAATPSVSASPARDVRVELVTSNAGQLGWSFYPLVGAMSVRPGELHRIQFHAKNNSGRAMTVRAIPSITPGIGAKHLVKTDCFCFQKQTLEAGESIKMPLAFYISPDLPEQYQTLTLSYALFEAERE